MTSSNQLKLYYDTPANEWTEALPLGNGRLGAMVFGGIHEERLALNEDTVWSGAPKDWNNPRAKEVLPEVRRLLFEGNYVAADELCKEMQGPYSQAYMPLGDLWLRFGGGDKAKHPDAYHRTLDLETAIATTEFTQSGVTYRREIFASHPDQVIVVRLTADQPNHLTVTAKLNSPLRHSTKAESDQLVMICDVPTHTDPSYHKGDDPIRYAPESSAGMTAQATLQAQADGGTITVNGDALHIAGATAVTLFLGAASSFNGFDKHPGHEGIDPDTRIRPVLSTAMERSYEELHQRHVADYQALFGRVHLDLGSLDSAGSLASDRPTDQRITNFSEDNDPQLAVLLFQFGRYLLIACSRAGTQAANLQGIWNHHLRPP